MFSVVITTHNRPSDLVEAVASVARQSLAASELIVVDDGSTPAVTADSIRIALDGRCPLRLIRHEYPTGPSVARNRGIREASQEWIAFLDDDDQFLPEKLKRVHDLVASNDGIDLVYHAATVHMVNEGLDYETYPKALPSGLAGFEQMLQKNLVGGTPMVVARRSSLMSVGGFDESLKAFEDYELWLRMARAGHRLVYLNAVLTRCNYVTRKRSVTKSDGAGMSGFIAIEAKYRDAYARLTERARTEHAIWRYDTLTHRAILNLRYGETLVSALKTWWLFKRPRQFLILCAACLGPRFLIHLKARMTSRRPATQS